MPVGLMAPRITTMDDRAVRLRQDDIEAVRRRQDRAAVEALEAEKTELRQQANDVRSEQDLKRLRELELVAQASSPQPTRASTFQSESPSITLSFPGGSVAKYVAAIRKDLNARGEETNIILKDDVDMVTLPAMDLTNVTLESALQILHHHEQHDGNEVVRLDLDMVRGGGAPIFVLSAQHIGPRRGSQSEEMVHVWNVSQLLANNIKADDMLTAIETALSLVRSIDEAAEIRFHEATGLVIARGTGEQVSTMDQVIEQLKDTAARSGAEQKRQLELERAQQAQVDAHALKERFEQAKVEMTQSQRERDDLVRELSMMHDRQEMMAREHQMELMQLQSDATRKIAELEQMIRALQDRVQKEAKPNEG